MKNLILLLTLVLGISPLPVAKTAVTSNKPIRLAVVIAPQYSGLIDVFPSGRDN